MDGVGLDVLESGPEQPAMEVDEPGSVVQKLIIDPVDPAAPTDVKSEADFGGDPDEVKPETLQEPWLRNLCVNHPRIATQTDCPGDGPSH